jgi:glycine cleavage system H protein
MNVPEDLLYTTEHEWLRLDRSRCIIGITDFAQGAMGDVVHIELPLVGTSVRAGEAVGEIETTKSVSEVYAPVAGTIAEVNAEVHPRPEVVNADPYGAGWLFSIEPHDRISERDLLTPTAYEAIVNESTE